jgi:hypothetical protein
MDTGTVSTFAASSSAQIFTGHRCTPHLVWAATTLGPRMKAKSTEAKKRRSQEHGSFMIAEA